MKKSIYSFVFQCSVCEKQYRIEEAYDETKEYICPGCGIKAIIPRKRMIYTVKYHPYTFRCSYCNKIQHTYDKEYKGEIDGYYVTECDCPGCGKHITNKEAAPSLYFKKGLW